MNKCMCIVPDSCHNAPWRNRFEDLQTIIIKNGYYVSGVTYE